MQWRADLLMAFLNANPGKGFTASDLQRHTGVAKKFVGRALAGMACVMIVEGKSRYGVH
jgi:hypothetical protein